MHIMLTQSNTPLKRLVATLLAAGLVLPTGLAWAEYKGENPMQESRDVAAAMLKELGQKLKAAMGEGGPINAIGVCNTEAPAIASRIGTKEKITITRVSTRARNPVLGVPNDWQAEALKQFEDGLAKGQAPAEMEYVQAVKAGGGSRMELRYAKPIVTQAMCLACHGDPEHIQADVKTKLDQLYPNDKATGYKVGELRGAVVVSRYIGYNIN